MNECQPKERQNCQREREQATRNGVVNYNAATTKLKLEMASAQCMWMSLVKNARPMDR